MPKVAAEILRNFVYEQMRIIPFVVYNFDIIFSVRPNFVLGGGKAVEVASVVVAVAAAVVVAAVVDSLQQDFEPSLDCRMAVAELQASCVGVGMVHCWEEDLSLE